MNRHKRNSPSIVIREWLVVVFGGITLAATSWLMGGIKLYGLYSFVAGASLTFMASIVPLPAKFNGADGLHGNKLNIKRLICFPFFWISFLFLIYITIQGFNPAWKQIYLQEGGWYVTTKTHIRWLPKSVESSYELMNAFRVLFSFGAAFMLMWGIWVGVQRRRSIEILFWCFISSGVAMAMIAILQDYTGTSKLLWTFSRANTYFWGTFYYSNQGAAFLCVVLIATSIFYFYTIERARNSGQAGGPHLLLLFFAGLLFLSISLAMTRGGLLFGSIIGTLFILFAIVHSFRGDALAASLPIKLVILSIVISGIAVTYTFVDWTRIDKLQNEFEESLEDIETDSRYLVSKITWDMSQKNLILGAGAGSWMYIFPMYQVKYPSIFYQRYRLPDPKSKKKWRREGIVKGRRVYFFAHNDILQFLYEFGIVGCLILLLGYFHLFVKMFLNSRGNKLCAIMMFLGILVICAHAFLDSLFQPPAYWIALNGLILMVTKLLVLDNRTRRAMNS